MKPIHIVAVSLIALVGVAGVGAGSAYLVLRRASPAAAAEAPAPAASAEEPDLVAVSLAKFVTDLADKDRPRYVDVTVVLALKSDKVKPKVEKAVPEIRDAILGHLRTLTASQLAGAEGKDRLAQSLQQVLNKHQGIRKVLITDLLVQ